MLDEANKDDNQEQSGASSASAEIPQAADVDSGVPPLPSAASSVEDHEQQKGTECDDACGQDGALQISPEGAVGCDHQRNAPDEHDGRGIVSSCPGEAQENPVLAAGTEASQDEANPEIEDVFTAIDESEEDKRTFARVMASYDEYLGRGEIREPGDGPDVPDLDADSPELKSDDYEPPPTLDLIRRAGHIEVARIEWRGLRPTLTCVGNNYRAPSMPSAVCGSIHLPNGVADYQSAREVFDAVYDALQNCSALSRQQCELLTFWCIASWFQDSLDFLPRLTITGPWYAAALLLTLLTYVCHKAIQLVDMSSAVLKEISMEELSPTLLIHQVKASKTAAQLLDATDFPGYIFAGAGGLRRFCCAKALYIGETCDPKQSMSGLHIHLGRNAPVPARPYRSSVAIEGLQNRLLSYRTFNRERTHFLEVPTGELQPEFDLMARRLGAVIINDSALQIRLVAILKGWSEEMHAERASGIEGTALTAVLNFAHSNEPQAYVREVAAAVNQIRSEQGEPQKLSNEKVGHVLKRLGLPSRRLDMKGRGLFFDESTQLLVHQLCFEHDVLPAASECGYCHELQRKESE